jgi:phosphopantothenoylcysteine decarboxylase/phosphopantothenate--cysteine ligase
VHFVDPGEGWLSCGVIGPGRMAEPQEILERVDHLLPGERGASAP